MALIDKLLVANNGKCDACKGKLGNRELAILELFEKSPKNRKTISNSLLICKDGAAFLQQYTIRDQVLWISGRYGDFHCPNSKNSNPKEPGKDKIRSKVHGSRSVKINLDPPSLKEEADKNFNKHTKLKNEPISSPSNARNTEYEKISTSYGLPTRPDDSMLGENLLSDYREEKKFNIDDVLEAIGRRKLNSTQILQIIDRSTQLEINSESVGILKAEYKRIIDELNVNNSYTVEPGGSISLVKLPQKPQIEFLSRPPFGFEDEEYIKEQSAVRQMEYIKERSAVRQSKISKDSFKKAAVKNKDSPAQRTSTARERRVVEQGKIGNGSFRIVAIKNKGSTAQRISIARSPGYYNCKNCQSYMFYSNPAREQCRSCHQKI